MKIPKVNTEPTWLEICRYPCNRFEEICSRILAFYLNPNAEHGMKDLWISALLDAINKPAADDWYDYRHEIKDITIISDNYVIAIENKITADLYNPLDIYKKYIAKTYQKKKQVLVVLFLKPIKDKCAMEDNDFHGCSYRDLFKKVNALLGNYIADANHKYLTYMVDFMKTIDNMNNSNSQIEKKFFSENRENIEALIQRYQQYKDSILQQQIDVLTGAKWWIWSGWDLGVTFNENSHKIGIESHFEEQDGNPFARFNVYITVWKKDDWKPYRERVKNDFEEDKPFEQYGEGKNSHRVFLYLRGNINDTNESIVENLKRIYDKMVKITSEIK